MEKVFVSVGQKEGMKMLLGAVALLVLVSGCTSAPDTEVTRAETACVLLCKLELNKETDLRNGPCLAEDLLEDGVWVCDVAHEPRLDTDDHPDNQCASFGNQATRFVEVDRFCQIIRTV